MQNSGMSPESILTGKSQPEKDNKPVKSASDLSQPPFDRCQMEMCSEVDRSADSSIEINDLEKDEESPGHANRSGVQNPSFVSEEALTKKRQKVSEPEDENPIKSKATEDSLVEWLKNHEGVSQDLILFLVESIKRYVVISFCGFYTKKNVHVYWLQATLTDIQKHFNGSTEDSVVQLLNCLESEFLVYKKNGMYRLM